MSNLLTEKPVILTLVIAMIIILFVIGINPIRSAYNVLTSVDDSETLKLTQKKDECNKVYEKDENTRGDCALEVVALLLDQTGDYFQAHAFLMRQIKNSASTQTNYEEALRLAKELYPKSKDWAGALEFYTYLSEQRSNSLSSGTLEEVSFEKTFSEIYLLESKYAQRTTIEDTDYQKLVLLSKEALIQYNKNPQKYQDREIQPNCEWSKFISYEDGRSQGFSNCVDLRHTLLYSCFQGPELRCLSCKDIVSCDKYPDSTSCSSDPCGLKNCAVSQSGSCSVNTISSSQNPQSPSQQPTPTPVPVPAATPTPSST